jgi:hypothetical protein
VVGGTAPPLVASPLGEEHTVLIEEGLGRPQGRYGRCGGEITPSPDGNRTPNRAAYSLSVNRPSRSGTTVS